jgi:hypothetical protein
MAWVGRIDSITDAGDFEHVTVQVAYFDAADTLFATALWNHAFSVEPDISNKDFAAMVVGLGQRERNVQAQVAALQSKVGTTVSVP